jgi:hypothetical protein
MRAYDCEYEYKSRFVVVVVIVSVLRLVSASQDLRRTEILIP